MFRLRLLGTPHLEGRTGVIAQGPRRIALLASLAAAGPAGLTRDKLIARLWPDNDADRARRNLSQLLYAMRTELGADLVDGTGSLRIDPAVCTADVLEFDQAVAARDDATAVRTYTGDFLDGLHLAESSEFSHWADVERDRRLTQVRAAALRIAEATQHAPDAATHWRKALSLDPLNASVTLRLMDALAGAGDRAGALRVADQHASLARAELDSDADPQVRAKAAEIRHAAPTERPATAQASTPATPATPPTPAVAAAIATTASTPPGDAPSAPPATTRTRANRAGLAVAALAVAVIALVAWSQRTPARLSDDEFVLVSRFENRTTDTLLSTALPIAFSTALQQSAFVVPLPRGQISASLQRMRRPDTTESLPLDLAREVAVREGVRLVIAGEVLQVGAQQQLVTRIIESGSGRVVSARSFPVREGTTILDAIDDASRRLRRDLGEARRTVAATRRLPEVTTPSLAALYAYGAAIDAERRGRPAAYHDFLHRAIAADSDFAAAHAKAAENYAQHNDIPKSMWHGDRALARADSLPVPEALRIKMSVAWSRGDREAMAHFGRLYVDLRPRDVSAWTRLAFNLFSSERYEEARAAYTRADSLAPLSNGSILNWGTVWLAIARRTLARADFDSARALYERAFRNDSVLEYDAFFNHQYGTILLGAGLPDSARASFARMGTRSALDRARALRSMAYLDAYVGDWSAVADRFSAASTIGVSQKQWTTAIRNDALLGEAYLALGDRRNAVRALDRAAAIAMREPIEARMLALVALSQVRAGEVATARRVRERMRAIARPEHDEEQSMLSLVDGAIAIESGRADQALEQIESSLRRDPRNLHARLLLARALEGIGRDSAALETWQGIEQSFTFGLEGQFDWQFAQAERARLLERLGRADSAVSVLRGLVARYPSRPGLVEPMIMRESRERLRRLETRKPPPGGS